MFGILNVNKSKGFTSHDVVAKLRKILNIKQVGHTGTLDPIATGVLPVCVGKATKVIQYLEDSKAYRTNIRLGVKTNTYDAEGEILEEVPVTLDIEKIKECLKTFQGTIKQKPPMFSAVHYKGKRLYEYARKNIEIEDIPERTVTINSIELIDVLEQDTENPLLVVDIDCSSGTYIRSIISDLGDMLGYGASMEGLIRTRAGSFKITDSYTIDKIQEIVEHGNISEILINPLDMVDLTIFPVNEYLIEKVRKGQYFKVKEHTFQENQRVALSFNNLLAAIAEYREEKLHPVNVFI